MSRVKTAEKIFGRVLAAAGLIAIACASIITTIPDLTLEATTQIASTAFFATGLGAAISHIHLRSTGDSSSWSLLNSAIGIIIGFALLSPLATAADSASWPVGFCSIALGVLSVATALPMRKMNLSSWSWALVSGLVVITCGGMLIAIPALLLPTLTIVVAIRGVTQIVFDFTINKSRNA